MPVTTAERLPRSGSAVRLHTPVIYREDSQTLYGFATPRRQRLSSASMIDNVTGDGPKVALSIMSRLSLALLQAGAIRSGDVATLSKCPGIGKKTAERLVVELEGKGRRVGGPAPFGSVDGAQPGAAWDPPCGRGGCARCSRL